MNNEDLIQKIHDLVYFNDDQLDDRYVDGSLAPTIVKLKSYNPRLADLFNIITGGNYSNHSTIRKTFKDEALPLLPVIEANQCDFVIRWCNERDLQQYSLSNQNKSFTVTNSFLGFYLNGLRCGGPTCANADTELICENFYNAKFIGSLSQFPLEKEVIFTEGTTFKIVFECIGLDNLLELAPILNNTTREYYQSSQEDAWLFKQRRYFYIQQQIPLA